MRYLTPILFSGLLFAADVPLKTALADNVEARNSVLQTRLELADIAGKMKDYQIQILVLDRQYQEKSAVLKATVDSIRTGCKTSGGTLNEDTLVCTAPSKPVEKK